MRMIPWLGCYLYLVYKYMSVKKKEIMFLNTGNMALTTFQMITVYNNNYDYNYTLSWNVH